MTQRRFPLLIALCLLGIAPGVASHAAVTFFGSVSPDPPGDGDVEETLFVGLEGDNDPDRRGYVQIDGGDQIEYNKLVIGENDGYRGEVLILGAVEPGRQTLLRLEEGGSSTSPTLQIGNDGIGQLTIGTGASLAFVSSTADLSIGVDTTGIGTLRVEGPFALLVAPDNHIIGDKGLGRMEVLDGGTVITSDSINTTRIGASASGIGTAIVDGLGSIWQIEDDLTIGGVGEGTLLISDNGLVDIDSAGSLTTVGTRGRLELEGGVYVGATTTVQGVLTGSGRVSGGVTVASAGLIDVPADALLEFSGDVSNAGSIRIRDGEATISGTLANLAPGVGTAGGRITLEAGRLRFTAPLTQDGVVAMLRDVNHVHGEIAGGSGTIVVAHDAVGVFYDSVDLADMTLQLLADANALFLADLDFQSGSLAAVTLGEDAGVGTPIEVAGAATLDGDLDISLAAGLTPTAGMSFPLLSAASGVSGLFDTAQFPTLGAGLFWNLDYGANDVVLEVLAAAAADFNFDGDVDGADLAIWEAGYGVDDRGDATGDGASLGEDFLIWQRTATTDAAPVAQPVPEPSTLWLCGIAAGLARRGRRTFFTCSFGGGGSTRSTGVL